MNVLIIHSQSIKGYPSGEYHVAHNECESLCAMGINAKLVLFGDQLESRPLWQKKATAGIKNIWSFDAAKFIKNEIDRHGADIVHFHGLFPYLSASALQAAKSKHVHVVQTLHNVRWLCVEGGFYRNGSYCNLCVEKKPLQGLVHRCKGGILSTAICLPAYVPRFANGLLFKWVDRFIAVSHFIRDQHILAGFPAEKIVVKNNSIDALPAIKKTNKVGIIFVGRVSEAKGSRVIKEIWSKLNVPFHIVGDGPDLNYLKSFCQKREIKHVKFWGSLPRRECIDLMQGAACAVVPSQCGESFSLVAAEAMSVGTPVIGSDLGGLGELIRTSGGGIAVHPHDLNSFIQQCTDLLDNPIKVEQLGARGKTYITHHLSTKNKTEELLSIYNSLSENNHCAYHI